ncbi:hypothetical protein J40TS1_33280 [Paenibacillus montaniterrae]|uniref:Uncharacterized protein n=1 Tax=Paenibacillus montaniterrae TaxID=429341 RepID=A0A919YSP2_9BACL|nr:hypothetical protein J40TS1_33280 [Paenibacillus montaniterrae]
MLVELLVVVELFDEKIMIMTTRAIRRTKKPTTDSTPIFIILHIKLGFFTLANWGPESAVNCGGSGDQGCCDD